MFNPFLKTYKIIEHSNGKGEKYFTANYGGFFGEKRNIAVNGTDWFSEENGGRFSDIESAEASIERHKQLLSDKKLSKFSSKIAKYV